MVEKGPRLAAMRVNEVTRPKFTMDSEERDGPIGHSLAARFSRKEEAMRPRIKPTEDHATAEKARAEDGLQRALPRTQIPKQPERTHEEPKREGLAPT